MKPIGMKEISEKASMMVDLEVINASSAHIGNHLGNAIHSLFRALVAATFIVVYFLVFYSSPGNVNLTFAYVLQTANGYRPKNHPFFLYFAPPSIHNTDIKNIRVLGWNTEGNKQNNEREISDFACGTDASSEGPPTIVSGGIDGKFSHDVLNGKLMEMRESLQAILSIDISPVRSELVLVDEVRFSGDSAEDQPRRFVIQREVLRARGEKTAYGRMFMQLSEDILESAVVPSIREQGVDVPTSRLLGSGLSCLKYCAPPECNLTASVDITNMAGIYHQSTHSLVQRLSMWILAEASDIKLKHDMSAQIYSANRIFSAAGNNRPPPENVSVARKYIRAIDPKSLWGVSRYSAKTHFMSPLQASLDYGAATAFVHHLNFATVFAPNTISYIHFLVAVVVGLCFWISSIKPTRTSPVNTDDEGEDLSYAGLTYPFSWRPPIMCKCWVGFYSCCEHVASLVPSRTLELSGCALFVFRTWLDGLDGVVARQRKHSLEGWGQYGSLIDAVADGAGCVAANFGILFMLYNQDRQVSPFFLSIIRSLPLPICIHNLIRTTRRRVLGRVVAFIGLFLWVVGALMCELFMDRFTQLLDKSSDKRVLEVEKSFAVRFCWFVWAICGGETVMNLFIISVATGSIWTTVQFAAVFGYVIMICAISYSFLVWDSSVMSNEHAFAYWQRIS